MYTRGQMAGLFKVLADPTIELSDFYLENEIIVVSYKKRATFSEPCATSNLILATTTTSSARCRLYKCLDIVQERAVYTDTDSIIYTKVPGLPNLETGTLLGELTSELGHLDHITLFCCAGAKNYAYQTLLGEEVCKVRGFTLNYCNSRIINFHSMRQLLLENPDGILVTTDKHKIKRDKANNKIYSCEEKRDYRIVQNKRIFNQEHFMSIPYGTCIDD